MQSVSSATSWRQSFLSLESKISQFFTQTDSLKTGTSGMGFLLGWELETQKHVTCYPCIIRIKNRLKRPCMLVQGLIWTVELHLWMKILTRFLGLWFFDNYRSKTGFLSVENVKIADWKKLNSISEADIICNVNLNWYFKIEYHHRPINDHVMVKNCHWKCKDKKKSRNSDSIWDKLDGEGSVSRFYCDQKLAT